MTSPALPSLPPELTNHPQYEVVAELGRGGMGIVYLANNKMMERREVLKVVSKDLLDKAEAAERFLREIRAAARLSHPNVVTAYTSMQLGDSLVFAMEYVPGEDLGRLVARKGPLPVAVACYYAQQVALGLQHAHEKGMVHRDVKPNNLVLVRDGKKRTVKILDFGLAKATSEKGSGAELTGTGVLLGTPEFIAPEQTHDAARADIRADVYGLGCTLYFLLTGRPPFTGASVFNILLSHRESTATPLDRIRPDVPPGLADVVAKMMAKAPPDRFQTPGQVAKALSPFFKPSKMAGSEFAPAPTAGPSAPTAPSSPNEVSQAIMIREDDFLPQSPRPAVRSSAAIPIARRSRTAPPAWKADERSATVRWVLPAVLAALALAFLATVVFWVVYRGGKAKPTPKTGAADPLAVRNL